MYCSTHEKIDCRICYTAEQLRDYKDALLRAVEWNRREAAEGKYKISKVSGGYQVVERVWNSRDGRYQWEGVSQKLFWTAQAARDAIKNLKAQHEKS